MVAFYLPQFHRIPENDLWWGEGFTEWTNVRNARPLFPKHRQPRIPGPLGYYDLTNPRTRAAQASLAQRHGIEGFCYWHYWFGNKRRLLERPFAEVLSSSEPDFPFCLCWANQSWTGIWHGAPGRMLMEQTYPGPADERDHFYTVLPAFLDPRYSRVEGKPMFLIYRPNDVPDLERFITHWRHLAANAGLPGLHIVGTGHGHNSRVICSGLDGIVPLGPGDYISTLPRHTLLWRLARLAVSKYVADFAPYSLLDILDLPDRHAYDHVVEVTFGELLRLQRRVPCDGPDILPSVLTGWDNTPRAGRRGTVLDGYTPEALRRALRLAIASVTHLPWQRRLVFIKAWNEWAEGNYLEPDKSEGMAYLQVVKDENVLEHSEKLSIATWRP